MRGGGGGGDWGEPESSLAGQTPPPKGGKGSGQIHHNLVNTVCHFFEMTVNQWWEQGENMYIAMTYVLRN